MFGLITRSAPKLMIGVLLAPVLAGLIGTLLPAMGYLPAAGLGTLSIAPIAELVATPGFARAAWLSLGTGLAAAGLSYVLAMLTVGLYLDRPVFVLVRRLLSPLLAVPHAAAAFGLAVLVVPSGLVARLFSPWATGWDRPPDLLIVNDALGLCLTAGLVAKETPFLVLMLIAALPQADASRRMLAARALGYGQLKAFLCGVAPTLYGQVRLAVFAVIVYSASNVDMAMILGPTTPPTLSVLALRLGADPDIVRRALAAAAALSQLGLCLVAIALWIGAEKLTAIALSRSSISGRRGGMDVPARAIGALAALYPPLVIAGGLVALGLWSVAGPWHFPMVLPESASLTTWMRTLPTLASPMGWTLSLGLGSAAIAVVLALLALEHEDATGRRPGIGALVILYAPLLVPQIAFLFGLSSLAVGGWVDGWFVSVLVAHLVFVLPYVYLSLVGPWRAFDGRYVQAAQGLGASRARVFLRIKTPMLLRPIATALALGFSVSVAQYLPTLLIGAGRITSVTTEAVALTAGQDRRVIGVVALVQAVLPGFAFVAALGVPAFLHRNRRGMAAGEGA